MYRWLVSLDYLSAVNTPLLESCSSHGRFGAIARLQAPTNEPVLFPHPEAATRAVYPVILACMSIQTYAGPAYFSSYTARADFVTSGSVQSGGGSGNGQSGLGGLQQQQQSISPPAVVNQSAGETAQVCRFSLAVSRIPAEDGLPSNSTIIMHMTRTRRRTRPTRTLCLTAVRIVQK